MMQAIATPESQQETITLFSDALRLCLAESIKSSTDLLAQLSQDPASKVRLAVAENVSTPYCIVELLALDHDPDVRYGMAANAQLPSGILIILTQDENPYVAGRALKTMAALAFQGKLLSFPEQTQQRKPSQRN
jgi:hypothetical protein